MIRLFQWTSFVLIMLCCCGTGCSTVAQTPSGEGVVKFYTVFTTPENDTAFFHYCTVWYRDSVCIQEILGVDIKSEGGRTTITNPLQRYRFMDLRSKRIADFHSFSDTAIPFHTAPLPDTLMLDCGWSFHTDKYPVIDGAPAMLGDTTVDGITYKRARFNYTVYPKERQMEGWFRCDGKGLLFSMEKAVSKKWGCTMVRFYDYMPGASRHWASRKVEFLADSLSEQQRRVLEAWKITLKQQ